jgi:hypothetical protein
LKAGNGSSFNQVIGIPDGKKLLLIFNYLNNILQAINELPKSPTSNSMGYLPDTLRTLTLCFLILGLLVVSCKKKDPAADIAGDYTFTVKASFIMVPWPQAKDTVFSYAGNIVRKSAHSIVINYAKPGDSTIQFIIPGVIYPDIDDDKNFSYPEFISNSPNPVFNGEVSNDGTLRIFIGSGPNGWSWSNEITGKKR